MEHLSNDHEDHPNQQENSHKLCNSRGLRILNLTKSQWKLRQKNDQNFPMEEDIVKQILASEEKNKSKRACL